MTDQQLPDPLVPAEVDLRDFAFMPLDVRRLRDCRLVATKPPEEALAAILLWSASWHQQPASSLPDDDVELSQLAGYGRAVREYKRIKEGSLYGFIRCSDGRWYHPVVAEKAAEGWNAKLIQEHKRACDRQRKANKERAERNEEALPMPPHPPLLIATYPNGIPTWRYSDSIGIEESGGGNSSGNGHSVLRKSRLKGQGQGQCKGQGSTKTEGSNKAQLQASTLTSGSEAERAPPPGPTPDTAHQAATLRGAMSAALRTEGVDVTPGNPLLTTWVENGVTIQEAREAVDRARLQKPKPERIPAKYLDPIIADVVKERGKNGTASGSMVRKKPWFLTASGIEAKGRELGVVQGEDFQAFRHEVYRRARVTMEQVTTAERDWAN